MKNYYFKLDANIWLDQNFDIEANSQEEAESMAKEIAKKLPQYAPKVYNGREGGISLELLSNYLSDWTFGDLRFDVVYVEEEE
jgi:hypothetical protein